MMVMTNDDNNNNNNNNKYIKYKYRNSQLQRK